MHYLLSCTDEFGTHEGSEIRGIFCLVQHMHRSNGINGQLPIAKWIFVYDDSLGIIQFPDRATVKVKMAVLP